MRNTVVNIENVYAAKEIGSYTIGNKEGNFNGDDIVVLPKAELTGELCLVFDFVRCRKVCVKVNPSVSGSRCISSPTVCCACDLQECFATLR